MMWGRQTAYRTCNQDLIEEGLWFDLYRDAVLNVSHAIVSSIYKTVHL